MPGHGSSTSLRQRVPGCGSSNSEEPPFRRRFMGRMFFGSFDPTRSNKRSRRCNWAQRSQRSTTRSRECCGTGRCRKATRPSCRRVCPEARPCERWRHPGSSRSSAGSRPFRLDSTNSRLSRLRFGNFPPPTTWITTSPAAERTCQRSIPPGRGNGCSVPLLVPRVPNPWSVTGTSTP